MSLFFPLQFYKMPVTTRSRSAQSTPMKNGSHGNNGQVTNGNTKKDQLTDGRTPGEWGRAWYGYLVLVYKINALHAQFTENCRNFVRSA